jgi:hypothetical protein
MCTYCDRKSAKSFRGRNPQFVYTSVAAKGGLDVFWFLGKGTSGVSRVILLHFWYNKLRLSVSGFPKSVVKM